MQCERCGTPCPQLIEGQIAALCPQCFDGHDLARLAISVGHRDEEADFFLSYASPDVEWAKLTAGALEKLGFRVVYQHRDFLYGHNFPLQIDRALRGARRIIALLSPHYLRSDYAWAEWSAAWAANPDNENRRIIPIRVAPCKVEGLMAAIHYLDLVGKPKAHWGDLIVDAVAPGWRRLWKSSALDAKPGAPATQDVDYFISYAPDDFQVASSVSQILEREGYTTRLWSPDVPRATNAAEETEAGLAGARQMLALLSPRYLESSTVWDEWKTARGLGKLLAAVKVSPCQETNLPPGATAPTIDLSTVSGDSFADTLLENLSPLWLEPPPHSRKIDYYITYAPPDRHWAEFVAETLRKEGYATRMCNPGRRRGPVAARKIHAAMAAATGVIGVFSQDYINSDNLMDEWQCAADAGLPLTAARVSRCEPGLLLRSASAIDLVAQTDASGQLLLDTLNPLWLARPERGTPDATQERPDFFLSYAETDRKWAEFAASVLEEKGHTVRMWNPERKKGPGARKRIVQAIRASNRVIALLSPHYLADECTREEWISARIFSGSRRALSLRIAKCDPVELLGAAPDRDVVGLTVEECAEVLQDAVTPSWTARWRRALRGLRGVSNKIEDVTASNEAPGYGPWGVVAPLVIALVVSFGLIGGGGIGSLAPGLQTEVRSQWSRPSPSDWTSPQRNAPWRFDGAASRLVGTALYKGSSSAPNGRADFDVSFNKGVTLLARASTRMDRYYSVRVDRERGDGLAVRVARFASGQSQPIAAEVESVAGVGRQVAFALEMDGPRFRLFANGSNLARWEDSAIPKGAVGLQASEEDGFEMLRGGLELRSATANGSRTLALAVPSLKLRY